MGILLGKSQHPGTHTHPPSISALDWKRRTSLLAYLSVHLPAPAASSRKPHKFVPFWSRRRPKSPSWPSQPAGKGTHNNADPISSGHVDQDRRTQALERCQGPSKGSGSLQRAAGRAANRCPRPRDSSTQESEPTSAAGLVSRYLTSLLRMCFCEQRPGQDGADLHLYPSPASKGVQTLGPPLPTPSLRLLPRLLPQPRLCRGGNI